MGNVFPDPIVGANFTSNTKNYPWHRPADITDFDPAVDYFIEKMTDPEQQEQVFALLEIETDVVAVVHSLLLQAISKGKIAIDLAILIAGPVARYISIIADESDVKYDMGTSDDNRRRVTPTSLKVAFGILEDDAPAELVEEVMPEEPEMGLMGAQPEDAVTSASPDEQSSMLGMTDEEEEPTDGLA